MTKNLIENSIKNAYSYEGYRKHIKTLITNGQSTSIQDDSALYNYSKMNDKRMDRLDKTLKVAEETAKSVQNLNNPVTFLVIAEGWCGDAAQVVPVLQKIAESSDYISLKIVLRDENEALMNQFLTNGSKSIPKIILLDADNTVIDSWGPRPSIATTMVLNYKKQNGGLDAEFKKNLQVWYNKDKGNNTQKDILNLLKLA